MQGEEKDADHRGNDIEITLPWGLEKNEMKPGSMATLTDDKLARFVIGQQKKSKFERVRTNQESLMN
jgi:hypothetical protein